jgi:hypothetical protein
MAQESTYASDALQIIHRDPAAPAHGCWWFESTTSDVPQIWCYTDSITYVAGDEVALHLHTTAPSYDLLVYRDGFHRKVVHQAKRVRGQVHETPKNCSEIGCGWPVSERFKIGDDWESGGYVAVVSAEAGGRSVRHEHWFAVRPIRPDPEALLLMATTSTWIAYNSWGGSNAYEGIWGPDGNRFSPVLSLERPWGHGVAWLPKGAPRLIAPDNVPIGWVPRYDALEWALANSFPKYYGTNGWAMYERHFVRWAEEAGYRVHVITQHDLHYRPETLDGVNALAVVGHDEYWTWEMRDHLEAYLSGGGHLARFAGNMGWQVRLEQDGRQQRCHKHFAKDEDPVLGDPVQQRYLTSWWDDHRIGRPAAKTFGVTGTRGMYANFAGFNPRHSGGFTVYRPQHWAFEGCDLYYGDELGTTSKIFAFEVDGLDYIIRNGLPEATGEDGIDADAVEVIALGLAALIEEDHDNEGTELFVGKFDCEFFADVLYGNTSPESVDRVSRGCGVILEYVLGQGSAFNAASCDWIMGLTQRDPFVERITHNVLSRYLADSD